MNRFLIGATNSNTGKTTFTLGLMRALWQRGYTVQPYKVGPDYIDPIWHSRAVSRVSCNLDEFLVGDADVLSLFWEYGHDADICVLEGVMGLYDGYGTNPDFCSSASVAKKTGTPVILLVDGACVSTSIAATVLGFKQFDPEVNIVGVVFNRVNSERHYHLLKTAVERYCALPVLGRLPVDERLILPSESLGLSTQYQASQDTFWETLVSLIERYIDLNRLLELTAVKDHNPPAVRLKKTFDYTHVRLAIARDEAFQFYYSANIRLLESLGVTCIEFSPLHDEVLPECNALYIGDGKLEKFVMQLAANERMRHSILEAHNKKIPIYAECSGLLYLGKTLMVEDVQYPMVGVFSGEGYIRKRLQNFGYCFARALQDNLLVSVNTVLRSHTFHYGAFITELKSLFSVYKENEQGHKTQEWQDGYQTGNTFGSFLHLHFLQDSAILQTWLDKVVR